MNPPKPNKTLPKCGHTVLVASCSKCGALKAAWNAKVESSGVENIEDDSGLLKEWASSAGARDIRVGRLEAMKAREQYYRAAGHFLWEYEFETDLDRKIWEMHANGRPAIEISRTLKLQRKGKDAILNAINRLAKVMGVKCRS